jgi:hypothetical protein
VWLHSAGEAQERQDSAEQESHAALISGRGGAVLGPYSILKEDHFKGEAGKAPQEWIAVERESVLDVRS